MKISTRYLAFSIFLLIGSCREQEPLLPVEVNRAFYFWKNNSSYIGGRESKSVDTLGVQKLYVKFFEVSPNQVFGAIPSAKTNLAFYGYTDSTLKEQEIIPTVFVRNSTFNGLSKTAIDSLAGNMIFLIDKYYGEKFATNPPYQEIQIDCDWTESTKEAYFQLLSSIKKQSGKLISCTLRLYPYRYPDKMGKPPVDRAMLMCYNLISPTASPQKNSVLDMGELKPYLDTDDRYPLPLDVALPIFSLVQVHRNGQFMGLLPASAQLPSYSIKAISNRPLWHTVTSDIEVGDAYLRAGDELKIEAVSPELLEEATDLLQSKLPLSGNTTIALFHLDEDNLKKYDYETLHHLYTAFAQ